MNLILVSGWPVHDLAAVVSGVGGSNPVNEEVLVLNRDSSEQRSRAENRLVAAAGPVGLDHPPSLVSLSRSLQDKLARQLNVA